MKPLAVDVGDVVEGMAMSVTIRGGRQLRIRLAIGSVLLRIAAWVIGMGRVDITVTDR